MVGSALFVTLALLLFSIPVFYQFKLQKRKKIEAIKLLANSLEVEKQTRQQLSADIHDGWASELSAMYHMIQYVQKHPQHPADDILQDVKLGLKKVMDQTRDMSHSLVPPALETHGLLKAIEDLMSKINLSSIVQCQLLSHEGDVSELPASTSYHMFRIIQELLNNSIKHAPGSICTLSISLNSTELRLEYDDNAAPFDFFQIIQHSEGNGLTNILARVRALHGELVQIPKTIGNQLIITCKR